MSTEHLSTEEQPKVLSCYRSSNWKQLHESLGKMLKRYPELAIEPVGDVSETPLNGLQVEMCEGVLTAYLIPLEEEL